MIEDVIIIGAGPAGLATAIQLQRQGITARVFECSKVGGLLWNANLVENYPGFPRGVTGEKLVRLFKQQADHLGVCIVTDGIIALDHDSKIFDLTTLTGRYQCRIVVIASGTTPLQFSGLDLPDCVQDRIFYEVYPLLEFHNQRVIVVGAGDAAFDYALNLSKKNKVIILNRSERVNCLPLLLERAMACPRITYYSNTLVVSLQVSGSGGLLVECSSPTSQRWLNADYLLGALGRQPRLDFVSTELLKRSKELEQRGILHYVGDVKNGSFRQTAIAVGDGILAAMKIHRLLLEEKGNESTCIDG